MKSNPSVSGDWYGWGEHQSCRPGKVDICTAPFYVTALSSGKSHTLFCLNTGRLFIVPHTSNELKADHSHFLKALQF